MNIVPKKVRQLLFCEIVNFLDTIFKCKTIKIAICKNYLETPADMERHLSVQQYAMQHSNASGLPHFSHSVKS